MILLLLAVFAAGTAQTAFSEPGTGTNDVTGDSIAPMKLEIDPATGDITKTRTVIITNTGETVNEYVFYVEQTGGKNDLSGAFELSESAITLLPGDSKTLDIGIPVQALKTNLPDAEYKLKIIRNPETQTPVGYIIPIKSAGSEPDTQPAGGKNGTQPGLTTASPENEMKPEKKNTGKAGDNYSNSTDAGEKEDEKTALKKGGILMFLVLLMLCASAVAIIQKKKKEGKD